MVKRTREKIHSAIEPQLAKFISRLSYEHPHERSKVIEKSPYRDQLSLADDEDDESVAVRYKNKLIHGYRGTSNGGDLGTDWKLFWGALKNTDRVRRNRERVSRIQVQHPDLEYVHVGHSLGGSIASQMAHERDQSAVTFNRGVGLDFSVSSKKQKHFRTHEDLISTLDFSSESESLPSRSFKIPRLGGGLGLTLIRGLQAHGLDNFSF